MYDVALELNLIENNEGEAIDNVFCIKENEL
jgi:hypothetical protein